MKNLIWLPIALLAQIDFDPNERGQCPTEDASAFRWDERRNRCVFKREASEGREAFEKCRKIDDEAERKRCLEANRDRLAGGDAATVDDPLEGGLSIVTASVPLAFFTVDFLTKRASKIKTTGCRSQTLFKASSVAGVAAELYFKLLAGRQFDRIRKEYEDLGQGDPASMQVASFRFLEDQQREVASIAGRQHKAYTILAVAYVSAAALAALESGLAPGFSPCLAKADRGADAPNPALLKMASLMGHSPGITILSGIMTALYTTLAKGASRARGDALRRAEVLKETRERFEDMVASSGACRSRTDISVPRCYCYTEEGRRHPQRKNSESCQKLWAFHDRNLFAKASNDELGRGEAPPREGCVDLGQQFDADCKCLERINTAGENTCYKSIDVAGLPESLPEGIGVAESIKDIDALTSGALATGSLSGQADLGKRAAAANVRLKKILREQDEANQKKGNPAFKQFLTSLDKDLGRLEAAEIDTADHTLAARSLSGAPLPHNLSSKIKESLGDKKLGEALAGVVRAGPRASDPKGTRRAFNESAASGPKVIDAFMDDDYDYSETEDDIVGRSDVTLWTILSKRYVQTGLERIFGQGGP